MTRLAKGSDISVLMPEFTDENTIDVSDENDREELTAYFEKMNEQVPDLKSTVIDILKMLGINIGGSTEEYLSGSYTPSGVAALVTLTFDESGKVVCTILGFDTEGTYSISGNEITLDFGSGHALTGTFSFENKDTSIVIDGTEYYKK